MTVNFISGLLIKYLYFWVLGSFFINGYYGIKEMSIQFVEKLELAENNKAERENKYYIVTSLLWSYLLYIVPVFLIGGGDGIIIAVARLYKNFGLELRINWKNIMAEIMAGIMLDYIYKMIFQ